MTENLSVPQHIYSAMLRHLQLAYPLEACGILAGSDGQVQRLFAVANRLRSPIAYEMDPQQQLQAMLELEEAGLEMLAIYHSHPHGPQIPSATDIAQSYYPESAHLIVSLVDRHQPVARAFMIQGDGFHEIALIIV